jgi:N-acetylglucosaminyldiphosphoundecaprenol N-acetyl-beta-D-mannosaminyltransferase
MGMIPLLKPFEQTSILGLRIDVVCLEDLISYTLTTIREGEKAIISNVNVRAVNLAYKNKPFRSFINTSQVVFCDGFGVKWTVRLLRGKNLHRYTPPDWFGHLAGECAECGISMYFLGTRQEVVEKAAAVIKEKFPDLKILGVHHGFFDKTLTGPENQELVKEINRLQPDILIVGFGMPAQEKWIAENIAELNVHVVFPVGAYFDYIAGEIVRAPRWMTDHGFEWLGRLMIEPKRLWKRYLIGNPLFVWRVFVHHILGFPLPD